MVNVKTPNQKRKSLANAEGATQAGQTPKVAKPKTPLRTPGKGKGNATPGRLNKTPQNQARQGNAKTPRLTPQGGAPKLTPQGGPPRVTPQGGAPKLTPQGSPPKSTPQSGAPRPTPQGGAPKLTPQGGAPKSTPQSGAPRLTPQRGAPKLTPEGGLAKSTPQGGAPRLTPQGGAPRTPKFTPAKPRQQGPGLRNTRNKRAGGFGGESSPPKKLKKFSGTKELQGSQDNEKQGQGKSIIRVIPKKKNENKRQTGKKRSTIFFQLKEKVKSGDKSALEKIELKIKEFGDRKDLTKTAKRKLKYLHKLKKVLTGEKPQATKPSVSQKKRVRQQTAKAKKVGDQNKQAKVIQRKIVQQKIVKKEDEDDDSGESDYDVESEIKPAKIIKTEKVEEEESEDEEGDEEGSDGEEEAEDEEGSGGEEEAEDEEDSEGEEEAEDEEGSDEEKDEVEGEEEDESDEEEEEEKPVIVQKGKKTNSTESKTPNLQELKESKIIDNKKTRYIVFVGNLPYDATREEISEHFNKAGEIRHIRIPTDIKTNKPRGFAYVEFHDEISYQKALSMHHTFIKGRRINCLYTQGGKKKGEERKNEVKVKNFKLQAMRNRGQLAGSIKRNQQRSARRGKPNARAVNGRP